jgi:Tol biopolymer transport system component
VNVSNNATYDIFSMNPDGSGVTQLTFFKSDELAPSWSPDRSKIAFASNRAGSYDIWIMQANGAVPVRLTTDGQRDELDPAWSPDGTRIAYTSMLNGIQRILITDVTTKVTTILSTAGSFQASAPVWSPDGKRIAFTSSDAVSCGIRIADVGGSGNIVDFKGPGYGMCGYSSFSPDGTKLVFQNVDPNTNGMMVMTAKVDGTGGYNGLTFGFPFQDGAPVWSSR